MLRESPVERPPLSLTVYQEFVERGADRDRDHNAIGLAGEIGELANAVKKVRFYGRPMDRAHLIDEAGDVLFYLAAVASSWAFKIKDVVGVASFAGLQAMVSTVHPRESEPLHRHVLWLYRNGDEVVGATLAEDPCASAVARALHSAFKRLARIAAALNTTIEDLAYVNMRKIATLRPAAYGMHAPGQSLPAGRG